MQFTGEGIPHLPALADVHFPMSLLCILGVALTSSATLRHVGSRLDFSEHHAHYAPAEDQFICLNNRCETV